jgi:hypothetical protein
VNDVSQRQSDEEATDKVDHERFGEALPDLLFGDSRHSNPGLEEQGVGILQGAERHFCYGGGQDGEKVKMEFAHGAP